MSAPDLKPCPFCGDRAELLGEGYSPDYAAGVLCKCGAGILGQYQHEAIATWNTRTPLAEAQIEAAIKEGMRIAIFVPIEQVPEALAAALRKIGGAA